MSAASGTYHAVPLRLVGGTTRAPEAPALTLGTTGWASPPPPKLSARTINAFFFMMLVLLSSFIAVGHAALKG